jgi:uncharacterized protein (TIGR01244 family)
MYKITNYIKINEKLSTSGQPTKKQFKKIAKAGFEVVINLAMHNKGALKEEDKIVSKNGMLYIHIPVTWKKPERERLKLFYEIFHTLEQSNKKVLIHCILNHRASVFLYKYNRDYLGKKRTDLIAPKGYTPNKVWRALIEEKSE